MVLAAGDTMLMCRTGRIQFIAFPHRLKTWGTHLKEAL